MLSGSETTLAMVGTAERNVSVGARARSRPVLADLGLNRLACALLGLDVVIAAVVVMALPASGLSVQWTSAIPLLAWDAVLLSLWTYLALTTRKRREFLVAETVMALALTLIVSHVLAPAQYVAVSTNRPLIDPLLASADRMLGVNVGTFAAWTATHPVLAVMLRAAYFSLLPQFALVVPLLGMYLKDRERLWEYLFHFHFCAGLTVLALAVFPAACAFQFYGFDSLIDQSRFIAHFNGTRDGAFKVIQFNNLEGLVSMPSFHVAGGLMVVWALRQTRALLAWAVVLNVLLIAATVMTGAHYVVDVVATIAMFAISVVLWQLFGRALVVPREESLPLATRAVSRAS
jgi:PAP2 superfamily